jgi:hypothetical protein
MGGRVWPAHSPSEALLQTAVNTNSTQAMPLALTVNFW